MKTQYHIPKGLNLPSLEQEILSLWQAENIFKTSIKNREGKTPFVFFEGPP